MVMTKRESLVQSLEVWRELHRWLQQGHKGHLTDMKGEVISSLYGMDKDYTHNCPLCEYVQQQDDQDFYLNEDRDCYSDCPVNALAWFVDGFEAVGLSEDMPCVQEGSVFAELEREVSLRDEHDILMMIKMLQGELERTIREDNNKVSGS